MALKKAHFPEHDFDTLLLCFCFTLADQAHLTAPGTSCSLLKQMQTSLLGNLLPKKGTSSPISQRSGNVMDFSSLSLPWLSPAHTGLQCEPESGGSGC